MRGTMKTTACLTMRGLSVLLQRRMIFWLIAFTLLFSTVLIAQGIKIHEKRVKNSQNQPVDNALASYYSGAWRQIGNTVSGVITKELLPVSLSFRINYGTQQQDKTQNLSTNNVVKFGIQ